MTWTEKTAAFFGGLFLCVSILICWLHDFALWLIFGDEAAPPP